MIGGHELGTVEDRVIRYTAERLSVSRERLSPGTRLVQDLGINEDCAKRFFDEFGESFDVELDGLHANWERHFVPETSSVPVGEIIVLCGCVATAFFLKDRLGLLPTWGWAVVLIGIASLINQQWFATHDMCIPITVGDLVRSAQSGRWSKQYR